MNGVLTYKARSWPPARTPELMLVGIAASALALPVALGLARSEAPFGLELVGGAAFLTIVALAVARLDAAVVLGLALTGIVLVEPAPADVVLVDVIAVATVTGRIRGGSVPPIILGALGALLALNLLSAVEVVDATRAAVYLSITAYLIVLAVWLSGYVASLRTARLVTGAYAFAAVASAALGALAFFVGIPGSDLLVKGGRVQAFFQDPNVFGPFLVPIALILTEDIVTPRLFRLRRLIKVALVLLLVLGVTLSFSRGAWVNLTVGAVTMLGILALRRGGGGKALLTLVLALALAGSVMGILSASGSQDFLADRARLQGYDATRFSAHVVGIESAERYPLGVGPGQFESYAPISAHSTYIRVVGEQGLPGLLALLAILVPTLIVAARNALAGRDTYGIGSAALLGAWCGLLVNSLVVDTIHWRHLWIVAAFIWAGWARKTARPELRGFPYDSYRKYSSCGRAERPSAARRNLGHGAGRGLPASPGREAGLASDSGRGRLDDGRGVSPLDPAAEDL